LPGIRAGGTETIKREITISYNWHCESFAEEIPFSLAEVLEEHTYDRVYPMMKDGFTSGELCCNANIEIEGKDTPEDGWECHGFWSVREVCL